MVRALLEIASASCVVILLCWLAMEGTAGVVGILKRDPPRYSMQRLFVLLTAIAVAMSITSAMLRN